MSARVTHRKGYNTMMRRDKMATGTQRTVTHTPHPFFPLVPHSEINQRAQSTKSSIDAAKCSACTRLNHKIHLVHELGRLFSVVGNKCTASSNTSRDAL